MIFGCTWVADLHSVALQGPVFCDGLDREAVEEKAVAKLRDVYGDAVLGSAHSRVITVIENGCTACWSLVPVDAGSAAWLATGRAWESLRSQLEYRAKRLGIMGDQDSLSYCGKYGTNGNAAAREAIVEFLRGAGPAIVDGVSDVTVGQVLDGLDEVCRAAGVPFVPAVLPADQQDQPVATPKQKRRRRSTLKRMTPRQVEIMGVVGDCEGNIAEAARRLALDQKTVREAYEAACRKAGVSTSAIRMATKRLPRDRRDQVAVTEDRRLS
jgi:hypothetical protein